MATMQSIAADWLRKKNSPDPVDFNYQTERAALESQYGDKLDALARERFSIQEEAHRDGILYSDIYRSRKRKLSAWYMEQRSSLDARSRAMKQTKGLSVEKLAERLERMLVDVLDSGEIVDRESGKTIGWADGYGPVDLHGPSVACGPSDVSAASEPVGVDSQQSPEQSNPDSEVQSNG